tara:strand:- start:183 stop:329 length:147 start_codon:yes stop_codon:yes gene_type:complete
VNIGRNLTVYETPPMEALLTYPWAETVAARAARMEKVAKDIMSVFEKV